MKTLLTRSEFLSENSALNLNKYKKKSLVIAIWNSKDVFYAAVLIAKIIQKNGLIILYTQHNIYNHTFFLVINTLKIFWFYRIRKYICSVKYKISRTSIIRRLGQTA